MRVCIYIYVYILRLRCTNTFKLIFQRSNLHSQVSDCNFICLTSLTLSSAFLNAHWVWDSRTDKWVKERMRLWSYWSRSAAKARFELEKERSEETGETGGGFEEMGGTRDGFEEIGRTDKFWAFRLVWKVLVLDKVWASDRILWPCCIFVTMFWQKLELW